MANVLNRTTKEFLPSANTPEYPTAAWIHNPNLSAVAGFDRKYWTVTGDAITLMNQAQRDAVDAAELTAARDNTAAQMDELEGKMRAFTLALLDELNLHATRITAILTAIDNNSSLANIKTAVLAIQDVPQRTIAQLKTVLRNKLGT